MEGETEMMNAKHIVDKILHGKGTLSEVQAEVQELLDSHQYWIVGGLERTEVVRARDGTDAKALVDFEPEYCTLLDAGRWVCPNHVLPTFLVKAESGDRLLVTTENEQQVRRMIHETGDFVSSMELLEKGTVCLEV